MDALFKQEPDVKLLVELCAVMGGSLTMRVAKDAWALMGAEEDKMQPALMSSMKNKMLTSLSSKGYAPAGRDRKSSIGENLVFSFVHLRIGDVAIGSILKQRKKELHEICYEVLSSEEHNAPPEVLAAHKEAIGDAKTAADFYIMAQADGKEKFNPNEVVAHCIAGLRCVETIEELDVEWQVKNIGFMFWITWANGLVITLETLYNLDLPTRS